MYASSIRESYFACTSTSLNYSKIHEKDGKWVYLSVKLTPAKIGKNFSISCMKTRLSMFWILPCFWDVCLFMGQIRSGRTTPLIYQFPTIQIRNEGYDLVLSPNQLFLQVKNNLFEPPAHNAPRRIISEIRCSLGFIRKEIVRPTSNS